MNRFRTSIIIAVCSVVLCPQFSMGELVDIVNPSFEAVQLANDGDFTADGSGLDGWTASGQLGSSK